ncbi:MAG TPA: dihydroneopterin aldolase [Candidatus Polarisedimenticolia bacterium]|jgi:dihydroneopterin aldolase|nr:dihydroneopterin aldolase [Candidatus Polarisedimenticolia bacterium]
MDRIVLHGVRFHGFHGLTRMEREVGGRYSVDVEMTYDISRALASDRIGDTVDYRKVHQVIQEIGRGESYRLIEALAGRIVTTILQQFPVDEVFIRLHKETPVLDGIVQSVGVEMRRRRADL